MERVLFAILCGDSTVHATWLHWASMIEKWSADPSHRFEAAIIGIFASPQEMARNEACKVALEALRDPEDTLVMIDNDMIYRGKPTIDLLDTPDYDIAGPLQYQWRPREAGGAFGLIPCSFVKAGEKGQYQHAPSDPSHFVSAVDRVGSGMMAIKRKVIADPRMLLAEGYDPPALWRNVFTPNYERTKGLDMDFCDRAKALSYRIVSNWKALVGHYKRVDLNQVREHVLEESLSAYEMGVRHGIQMARSAGGSVQGDDGEPRLGGLGDKGMGEVGVDRADDPDDDRLAVLAGR